MMTSGSSSPWATGWVSTRSYASSSRYYGDSPPVLAYQDPVQEYLSQSFPSRARLGLGALGFVLLFGLGYVPTRPLLPSPWPSAQRLVRAFVPALQGQTRRTIVLAFMQHSTQAFERARLARSPRRAARAGVHVALHP